MTIILVLLIFAFVSTMYLWTPKTPRGIMLYVGLVLLILLISMIVKHSSK